MIDGRTDLIAHIGYPTSTFKAPLIYNPYFADAGINAVVVPMGVRAEDFAVSFRSIFRLSNIRGALITMPHKVTSVAMLDQRSRAVEICGACNAVRREPDGMLTGDMFDGEGFVRGVLRKGRVLARASVLIVGSGGVGSAIAASMAEAGVARIALHDLEAGRMVALADRLRKHYPALDVTTGSNDPAGHDVVVNATPLGMNAGDPMPLDTDRLDPASFVGEVVMKQERTVFLAAAARRGCAIQIGVDMLFEQIPAYLEFFGYPTTTPDVLRSLARIDY
ncbi:MAG: shikimate dehydrogenase [Beijerinckiaceae bacterium]|nr:shikimate dehydrogenase [Beijerinckiaceae bacterium]